VSNRPVAQQGIHTMGYGASSEGRSPHTDLAVVDYKAQIRLSLLLVPHNIPFGRQHLKNAQ
jgi:hypothetical protein